MLDFKYAEHNRIDQYLKRRSFQIMKNKKIINYDDKLSNFPIGLIIIAKDEKFEDKIEFINHYACQLFQIQINTDINQLKEKLDEYIRLKNNNNTKTDLTLRDLIFNTPSFTFEIENFYPFQCKHSKSIIIYIKINDIQNQKYIVIDKYSKYIEEQRYIEFNLIKNINYQYLHTLYHELNNPLNALLAISGEKKQFDSTEIGNSRIYNQKTLLNKKKTISNNKKAFKKEKRQSLDNSRSKIMSNNENNNCSSDIGSRINLLVKIIKIFIKNFILYLKTRADNLLSLKNEFNMQNEASDIINAVEVSEYEKDLTKHKVVKLNLEYILDLYMQKYHCLFKYKEIDYDTNFSVLRNTYVITDDFNFSYYIRQIYTYLYYVVPKKEGFYFVYDTSKKNQIKITIKKKTNGNNSKITEDINDFKMAQFIQTKEMTKEVLYSMSKKLKFTIEIFDTDNYNNTNANANNEQNNYLSIIMPTTKKDKATEEDEFKDDEINEMVGKTTILLDEKLRRKFPGNFHKNTNISTINIVDILNKSGDDKKENTDSFISLPKNYHFKNENIINKKPSDKNFSSNKNLISYQKNKFFSFNSGASNDSFLSKCLKNPDNKNIDKEKSKFRHNRSSYNNIITNKINNHSSGKNIFINITNINNNSLIKKNRKFMKTKSFVSLKEIINKNNKDNFKNDKSQKLKGIFTLINNYGYSEEYNTKDPTASEKSNTKNNQKIQISVNEQNKDSHLKGRASNISNNTLGLNESNRNSLSIHTAFFGKRNPSKSNFKSSCLISDVGCENEEKNKNNRNMLLNNLSKNGITLEYIKEESNIKENTKVSKKILLSGIEESAVKRNSQNITPIKSNKDYMTFSVDKKKLNSSSNNTNNINNNTLLDENYDENKNLFLEANKERIFKNSSKKNNNNLNFNSQSDIKNNSEEYEEENEESDDIEESEENEESEISSEKKCDCTDLLVVDDEEFNVMASQRMLKNLGYLSDKAYNGEECIKLIKEKKENTCKCNKTYYKIIFLDIVMPIMDGIKAAKKIQEMIENKEINENIKIVFISGNIDGADLQKSLLEIGCVKECLQKPVQIAKYEKMIEKYYNNT